MPTVLVVDDELSVRTVLRTTLERAGHRVLEAADGPSALRLAALHRPDLVLLDVGLPRLSGLEVARRLPSPDTPVLLITGLEPAGVLDSIGSRAVREFLEKPFSPSELLRRVDRALSKAGARPQ